MIFRQCLGLIGSSLVTTVLVVILTFADRAVAATSSLPESLEIVGPVDATLLAANPYLFDNGIHHEFGTLAASILTVSVSLPGSESAGLRKASAVAAARATSYFAALAASAQLTALGNHRRAEWFNASIGVGTGSTGALGQMIRSTGEFSVQIRGAAVQLRMVARWITGPPRNRVLHVMFQIRHQRVR